MKLLNIDEPLKMRYQNHFDYADRKNRGQYNFTLVPNNRKDLLDFILSQIIDFNRSESIVLNYIWQATQLIGL